MSQFELEQRVIPSYPSVMERYYEHKLYHNPASTELCNQDLLVMSHSNRISIITLAPTHDILSANKTVTKVSFETDRVNRLKNQVKGKWKKGGQRVTNESVLCEIECSDGSCYRIPACITGKIVEINRRLLQEPAMLTNKTWNDGFIAILLPPFQARENKQT